MIRQIDSRIAYSENTHSFQIPSFKYLHKDGRVGVIQGFVLHPDNGTLFNAEILFEREDGTTYVEEWRDTRNILGTIIVSEYGDK